MWLVRALNNTESNYIKQGEEEKWCIPMLATYQPLKGLT